MDTEDFVNEYLSGHNSLEGLQAIQRRCMDNLAVKMRPIRELANIVEYNEEQLVNGRQLEKGLKPAYEAMIDEGHVAITAFIKANPNLATHLHWCIMDSRRSTQSLPEVVDVQGDWYDGCG